MRQKKFILVNLLLTAWLAFLLSACSGPAEDAQSELQDPVNVPDSADETTAQISLIVSSTPVKCLGIGPDCLQVKYSAESDWEVLTGRVEGFEYETGYRYVLLVEALDSQAVSASRPEVRYKLVEIQEKLKDTEVGADDLAGTFWVLSTFGALAQPEDVSNKGQVSFQFDPADNRVSGRAGCNSYIASAAVDFALMSISIDTVGTTRMACQEEVMVLEAQYLDLLGKVASYKVEAGALYLFTNDGQVLIFAPGQPSR